MSPYTLKAVKSTFIYIRKVISITVLMAFAMTSVKSPAYAQTILDPIPRLPVPGVMVHLSPEFTPAHLLGITIHPDNGLQFDFLIHKGDQILDDDQKRVEYRKLVKYFLASLTIPDEDQWVNLSPYEKNRIIKDDFGKTEMGRDLLAEDYLLKQITSSLIYPEDGLGKKFWDTVYQRAWKEYHTTDIPVSTFNKVWIVPDQAVVYESGNSAYILQSHLKVMLEEDYLSLEKHTAIAAPAMGPGEGNDANDTHSIGSQVIREIILPELEKEVNEGKNFANLRQMYGGMVLATWYKRALMESLLGKVYADKARVKGVDQDPKANVEIYKRYLKAFKKGVFNFIKEDVDKYTNESIPRKYFSGGFERLTGEKSVLLTNINPREYVDRNAEWTAVLNQGSSSLLDNTSIVLDTPEEEAVAQQGPAVDVAAIEDEFNRSASLQGERRTRALQRFIDENGRNVKELQRLPPYAGKKSEISAVGDLISEAQEVIRADRIGADRNGPDHAALAKENANYRGLVVDDESGLADLLQSVLVNMGGFKVDDQDIARSGEQALAMIKANPKRYSFVFTDNNMGGGLTGYAFAKALKEVDPNLPVVIHTGNTEGLQEQIDNDREAGIPVPDNIKRILEKPASGMQSFKVVNELRLKGELINEHGAVEAKPEVITDAQALEYAQKLINQGLAQPAVESPEGEPNEYLNRNILDLARGVFPGGELHLNLKSVQKIQDLLGFKKIDGQYRVIFHPKAEVQLSEEQMGRLKEASRVLEKMPIVALDQDINNLRDGLDAEHFDNFNDIEAIGRAIDVLNNNPPDHFFTPGTDQKLEAGKAIVLLRRVLAERYREDEDLVMPTREAGMINYKAERLVLNDLQANLAQPHFVNNQPQPWLMLSSTKEADVSDWKTDIRAKVVGIKPGRVEYFLERKLVVNYIGKLLGLQVVEDGDNIGLRYDTAENPMRSNSEPADQQDLVRSVNQFVDEHMVKGAPEPINWAGVVENMRRTGKDESMTAQDLAGRKAELAKDIEDLKTAINAHQDIHDAIKFLDDPLLNGVGFRQVNFIRGFLGSFRTDYPEGTTDFLNTAFEGLKLEFSRFYAPQHWDAAESANSTRVLALIKAIRDQGKVKVLPSVMTDAMDYLEKGLIERKISPQQVETAISLDGTNGLQWFLLALQRNRNAPAWRELLTQVQGLEGQKQENQDRVRQVLDENMELWDIASWQRTVEALKRKVLLIPEKSLLGPNITTPRFLMETPYEVERRLATQSISATQVLKGLSNDTAFPYVEQKGPGVLSRFIFDHLSERFGPREVEDFMDRNWITHEFFVPLYYYHNERSLESISEGTVDGHMVDFLADFVARHNRENPDNQLELVQQNGRLMPAMATSGGAFGVKYKGAIGVLRNGPKAAAALHEELKTLIGNRAVQIEREQRQLSASLGVVIPTAKATADFETWVRNIPFEGAPEEDRMDVINESLLHELGWDFKAAKKVVEEQYRGRLTVVMQDGVSIVVQKLRPDRAMLNPARDQALNITAQFERARQDMAASVRRKGGIDLNSANLNLQIKRDGNGVPLPLDQQDMSQLSDLTGFIPEIVEIKPAVNVPLIIELQKSESSLPEMANPS